jgi:HPt (histidine-containing phosphotransfer) domain-containing protein
MPDSPQLPHLDRRHDDDLGGEAILDEHALVSLLELGGVDGVELILELIDLFLDDSAMRMRVLRESCRRGACSDVASAAHALKSSSANIGALALSRSCRELESRADGVRDLEPVVARVELMYAQVRECLNDLRRHYGA